MTTRSAEDNSHWLCRIIGAITVAGAAFVLLWFWETWDLSIAIRIAVSLILGIMFLVFGGSVWRWIDEIDTWS